MKITGTLVNYYFHCKRQCYLAGNRMNFEDDSELVKIGKALHEEKLSGPETEVKIENIKIDKIKGKYLIEYKKSNSDIVASKWQLYFYLYVLKKKGILKKGKLICFEKKTDEPKVIELELTEDVELRLLEIEAQINILVNSNSVPGVERGKKCKRCAYYAYCYL